MSIVGIVGEYNPFHRGHEHHLKETKEFFGIDSTVICVMSGDFVQRGDIAVYSKFARAEAACRCGVDLVVELPLPWVLSSAEGFASGAARLLAALGAEYISFGSECGNLNILGELAEHLLDGSIYIDIDALQKADASISFARARQIALFQRYGQEKASIVESPNNILAIEYIKAILKYDLKAEPYTVKRVGNGHDMCGSSGPKSAGELRELIYNGRDAMSHLPSAAAEVFIKERDAGRELADRTLFENAILSRLLMLPEKCYIMAPDCADGLGARIFSAVHTCSSLSEIYDAAKTKRYPMSRIRRAVMCAALGLEHGMSAAAVPFARVLAANKVGCELLRNLRDGNETALITKPAHINKYPPQYTDIFRLGVGAHDLFNLSCGVKNTKRPGEDWRNSPIIV